MAIRVAINGFGRIGKCILRAYLESGRKDLEFVAINSGVGDLETDFHLLKYDSTHGILNSVKKVENGIETPNGIIPIFYEPDPSKIDWKKYNVDIVMECSGLFTKRDSAAKHLTSGAKKVMVSAPCDGADNTVVYGVNDHTLTKDHLVISIGSCTTNCLAPIAKILNDTVGIDKGFMTTIHAYTNDQRVLDSSHKDLRRARACAVSMIPSSTGAAKALGLVLPELTGKLDGVSMRVPLKNVSFVDLKFTSKRATSANEINDIIKAAKVGKMAKVLDYVTEELVSIDYNHNPFSSSFDASQTKVIGDTFCRIGSWYDNEWGFSNRMLDVAAIYAGI